MKHLALAAQLATLTMAWSSNRADAMAAAAMFSVLPPPCPELLTLLSVSPAAGVESFSESATHPTNPSTRQPTMKRPSNR